MTTTYKRQRRSIIFIHFILIHSSNRSCIREDMQLVLLLLLSNHFRGNFWHQCLGGETVLPEPSRESGIQFSPIIWHCTCPSAFQVVLSFNTLFLGFSFLFGSAASNFFEGILLIFVRRPYDIGDRVATSNPNKDTDPNGSSTWFVDKVTLFTTTVRYATTNEVATYSNGSLASLRIINANRSPKGIIAICIKFGLETPFSKVAVFRTAVENFIKARPRWVYMWCSLIHTLLFCIMNWLKIVLLLSQRMDCVGWF